MKKYKVRLVGMGIEAVGIIPFENEPTIEEVENSTALYLNEKLMKVEQDGNFYASNSYMLTYEELQKEKNELEDSYKESVRQTKERKHLPQQRKYDIVNNNEKI